MGDRTTIIAASFLLLANFSHSIIQAIALLF
jgi:hypothetical protein